MVDDLDHDMRQVARHHGRRTRSGEGLTHQRVLKAHRGDRAGATEQHVHVPALVQYFRECIAHAEEEKPGCHQAQETGERAVPGAAQCARDQRRRCD